MSKQLEALKNSIREILSEIEKEEEDKLKKEISVTGGVAGYDTPRAFSNKGTHEPGYVKRMAGLTGYSAVNESTEASDIIKDLDKVRTDLIKKVDVLIAKKKKLYSDVDITTPMSADEKKLDKDIQDIFSQIQQLIQQKRKIKNESINENRFQKLRLDQTLTPNQKIGLGVREIRRKVDEIEKFLEWYGKIKKENSLKGENFWKRTNHHIYRIKERLSNIGKNVTTLRK